MKFTGTTQGTPLKEIIFEKKLSWKSSDVLFQELEQCYGIKFLLIGEISKPTFKKKIRQFLFQALSDRDDYVEVDTLIQVLKL